MTSELEIREMVLSVALGLAASVLQKAEDAELQQAHLVDEVDAAGATWRMRAVFYRETMSVQVSGEGLPHEPLEGMEGGIAIPGVGVMVPPAELLKLFGGNGVQPTINYVVPAAWVKLATSAGGGLSD
jgi:hypothetical protein